MDTPSRKPIGHDLTRHSLVRLNRIRTGYGRFNYNMNLMGLSPSASCEYGTANQTAPHIASECPLQLRRGLGHIEHCRTQLASRPAVCRIEEESSIKRKKKKSAQVLLSPDHQTCQVYPFFAILRGNFLPVNHVSPYY